MIKPFRIRPIEDKIRNKASKAIIKLGGEWVKESVKAAPTGPTGNLKRGLVLIDRPGTLQVRLISSVPYARRIAKIAATHVPRAIVGQAGWQDSASAGKGSRRVRYYRGLRAAHKSGAPRYVWDYVIQALRRIGGVERYRVILGNVLL